MKLESARIIGAAPAGTGMAAAGDRSHPALARQGCQRGGDARDARPPGPAAAMALTGSFVVEKIFAVPGIGVHFVDAVLSKDLTLIMGIVLVYSTMLVVMNLIVDVLYRWADPRIA